jgi:hypothetical protein
MRQAAMPSTPNYYKVLQIDPEADPEVITAAYRRLSHKFHPDLNRDARAQQRMLELNRAYEVLSNPAQRAAYDRTLKRQSPAVAAPPSEAARARESQVRRVLGAPIAAGLPPVLELGRVPPGKIIRRELEIHNAGGGFLDGAFTCHADWLKVFPASFKSNAITVELVADPRRLATGHEYHARLDLVYDGIQTSSHVKLMISPFDWRRWAVPAAILGGFLLLAIIAAVLVFSIS